ncbi:hypothetical protein KKB83_04940 [Patescibacteria group bacterium]|nr:hypothetical protein [Patescibacteria group bacterium]
MSRMGESLRAADRSQEVQMTKQEQQMRIDLARARLALRDAVLAGGNKGKSFLQAANPPALGLFLGALTRRDYSLVDESARKKAIAEELMKLAAAIMTPAVPLADEAGLNGKANGIDVLAEIESAAFYPLYEADLADEAGFLGSLEREMQDFETGITQEIIRTRLRALTRLPEEEYVEQEKRKGKIPAYQVKTVANPVTGKEEVVVIPERK